MIKHRILIVDDDPPVIELLRTYLDSWGYDVEAASCGEDALDMSAREPFDIVLCDWELPGLDGPEICRRVRAMGGDRYTYFVLLTVRNTTENIVFGIEAGADDYLTKPISGPILKVRLEAGIRLLRLERALESTNARLTQGLNRAATTLRSLLPPKREGPTLSFDWLFTPCSFVGGDIFNVCMLDDDLFSFYIVDVSGHGFDSALSAVTIGNTLRPRNKIADLPGSENINRNYWIDSPLNVAVVLNERFPLEPPDNIYFTLFYAVFDRRDFSLRWVRAGHPPPIILRDGVIIELDDGDPPIGFFEGHRFTQYTTILERNDRIFLYSDGVTDLNNLQTEMFGVSKLKNLIKNNGNTPLGMAVSNIESTLTEHRGNLSPIDDISLLALDVL